MAELAPLQRRLERYMQERGLKQTRQRQLILEVFQENEGHVAVDELLELVQRRMPGVGYATVYRALKLFQEAGIAAERHFGDGQTRYEAAPVGEHHDHLICLECGHIFEFEDPLIEDRQARVAASHGLSLVSHHHEIFGSCTRAEPCPYREARETRAR